jgi:hypothetical protein
MKKWLVLGFIFLIVYLAVGSRRSAKERGTGLFAYLHHYFNLLAWFLLVVYGLAFLYWIVRPLF